MPARRCRGAELLELLADTSWVWSQYDHQLYLNTVEGPGGDATVLRLKHPVDRHRHGSRAGADDRRQPRLVRRRSAAGHGAHRRRIGAEPRLRRRPAARRRQLPQLREPDPSRGDVAALRGDRRHGRRLPGPRRARRGRQRQPVQRVRGPTSIRRRSSACSVWSTTSIVRPAGARVEPGCTSGASVPPCSISRCTRRMLDVVRGLVADDLFVGAHDVADGGVALCVAEMAIASECGVDVRAAWPDVDYFDETPSRIVVAVTEADIAAVVDRCRAARTCRSSGSVPEAANAS